MPTDLKSLTRDELLAQFAAWSQPAYRVAQLLEWLYLHRVTSGDAMTNLPKALREQLRQSYSLNALELVRKQGGRDTTQKFLWRLADHALIESVLIPANPALYGEASDRHTLCVSTQVGCAYGCKFCASGLDGWKRNLTPDEIVEQVLATERWHAGQSKVQSLKSEVPDPEAPARTAAVFSLSSPEGGEGRGEELRMLPDQIPSPQPSPRLGGERESGALSGCASDPKSNDNEDSRLKTQDSRLINNLVIMGMGEPLANYDHLLKALRILNAPWGGGIGARKITISTSGLAPQIRRLADEPEQFRLALSLHGATDEVRAKIMPVNRKHPLRELTAALDYYQSKKERMITFEFILIAGVNDSLEQTRPLATLARRLNAKVNLIPYNKVEGLPWERPSEAGQEAFLAALEKLDVIATLRREKGHDIDAACGQLRLKTEQALARVL